MPHGRHNKDERKEIRHGNFSLDGSNHQTGDAAFTPATSKYFQHSRANTDSNISHNTQLTRVKLNAFFMEKGPQSNQKLSEGHITPNSTQKIFE
jgi:hypothetical protein